MTKLYVCYSYYHVYVTLIKALKTLEEDQIDIIITDQIPNCEKLLNRLSKSIIFRNVRLVNDINRGKKEFSNRSLIHKIRFLFSYKNRLNEMYKDINILKYDEINIYFDRQHLSQYIIINHNNINLLEDSRYSPAAFKFNKSFYRKLLEILNLIPCTGGSPDNIQQIECSDINMLPNSLRKKFKMSEIYTLEKELNHNDIEKMLSVFNFKDIQLEKKSCLILTQPLYQDNLISSEEKQKKIYNKVIEEYCIEFDQIYIKPHPRDEIKYSYNDLQKKIIILDKNIPFEIYKYFKIDFEKYITLFSTSIRGLKKEKVLEIGYQIDEELEKKYTQYIKTI